LQRDGVIFQQNISDNSLEDSAAKIKFKLDDIESDIKYIKEKKANVSDLRDKLKDQKDEIDKKFQKFHTEVVEVCNTLALNFSMSIVQAVSAIEREFEASIKIFAKFYPLLEQGLTNPTEFPGLGLTLVTYPYQKYDRKYQAMSENLLNKIATCRSIVNTLRPNGGAPPQTLNFINQVIEKADETEKQLKKQLYFANNELKNIWAKEETLRNEWSLELKEIEKKIHVVTNEQKEILKRLDNLLENKISTFNEIKLNITLPNSFLAESVYIPFWVACFSLNNEYRFLVYGPMKKKQDKKWIDAFQGFAMPLEPYSKGINKLRSEIEKSLKTCRKCYR
jgi:DNA repair exonuclease SbcCD ATPase subunit